MIPKPRITILLVFLIVLLFPAIVAAQQAFKAKVIGISDGDTITVLKDKRQIKIRLHGIDSPEKD